MRGVMHSLNLLLIFGIKFFPKILVAIFFRLMIKQRLSNGTDTIIFKKKSNKKTILALDSARYRGDIDVLARSEKFRVLHIRQGFQRLLIQVFLKNKLYIYDVQDLKEESNLYKNHKKTELLFSNVLSIVYKLVDIDCITKVHFKYLPDFYWTVASEGLNIPCIMLYRECNVMSPIIFDCVVASAKLHKKFDGTHVIVHNNRIKDAFIDSNFINSENVTVAGALRMDQLINNYYIPTKKSPIQFNKKRRKKFTLFYFPVDSSMFGISDNGIDVNNFYPNGDYWASKETYFIQLHETILKLAEKNPQIDFVIKPKEIFMYEKSWIFYEKVISESNVDIKKLKNYFVDSKANVHKLIMESDVICGGQSSTTVESLFLGKHVILPLFSDYEKTDYFKQFPWKNHLDLFHLARDIEEFEDKFINALESNHVSEKFSQKSKELYIECFSDTSGKVIDKYSQTIINVINQRKYNK